MDSGQALIVGGGIGGLTAALCLQQLGFVVQVYEQTDSTNSDGAGIQLSPNATRVLHQVGLVDALASISSKPDSSSAPPVAGWPRRWPINISINFPRVKVTRKAYFRTQTFEIN